LHYAYFIEDIENFCLIVILISRESYGGAALEGQIRTHLGVPSTLSISKFFG